jgi:hypothetical protein
VTDEPLDDLDRRIVLYVFQYRRPDFAGPTWAELRAGVGLPPVDRGQPDPHRLVARLYRLRWLRYLRFSTTPRSLEVGIRIREWQQQRRTA